MVGWDHRLNGHEFEQTPGDSEGQGSLACCSPWGHKKSDVTEQLNNNEISFPRFQKSDRKCRQVHWGPLFPPANHQAQVGHL